MVIQVPARFQPGPAQHQRGSAPEDPAPQLEGDSLGHAGSWPRVAGDTRLAKQERPIRGKVTVSPEGRRQQETGLEAEGSSPEAWGPARGVWGGAAVALPCAPGKLPGHTLQRRFTTKTLMMLALRGGAFSSSPTPYAGTPGADDRCGAARAPTLSLRSAPVRGWGGWASRADGDRVPGGRGLRARPAASTQARLETALLTGGR